MDIHNIRFANLDFEYDVERASAEIAALEDKMEILYLQKGIEKNQYRLPLFTEEQINNITLWDPVEERYIFKDFQAWKGTSLTYRNDLKTASNTGAYRFRNNAIDAEWDWREDIAVPYIRQLVESLQFVRLHTVRVFWLNAGSIGMVHNDDPTQTYYKDKGFSLTLNLKSGGSPLVFLNGDQRHDVHPGKCFIFKDDCWHGVPQVSSTRMQIRINGVIDEDGPIKSLIRDRELLLAN